MENTTNSNVIKFPKTASITDFAHQSLDELNDEVKHFFLKEDDQDDPEVELYMNLVGALTFRLMCNGMCKHELRDFMLREIDDAQDIMDELATEEEEYNQNEMEAEEL